MKSALITIVMLAIVGAIVWALKKGYRIAWAGRKPKFGGFIG